MVPEGWVSKKLGNISSLVTSGSRDWAKFYSDTGSKFIRMTNLRRGGIHLKMDSLKFVNVASDSADGKRTSLQAGDILISITAELGKIGWVPPGLGEAYINQHTALVRVKSIESESKFVAYLLCSKPYHRRINALNDAGAKAGLNLATIRSLPIALPPLSEQKKIAQILSTWDQAISAIERLLENSQQRKKGLMQQLLTGKKRLPGFEGEWNFISFSDGFSVANQKTSQVKSSEYQVSGTIPIVDQSQNEIAGYCENNSPYTDVPVIVFGDHTRALKWVDFPFCPGADGTQVLKAKPIMGDKFAYFILSHVELPNLGYSRHMRELKQREFKIAVDVNEQRGIADVLTTADEEIQVIDKRLTCLKQEKKALMQQLLTGKRRVQAEVA